MEETRKPDPNDMPRHAARDLIVVVTLTVIAFLVAARFELHELFSRSVADLERWQVDELPATLTVLIAGLAWFAWRRWREGARWLEARRRAEAQASELLESNRHLARRLFSLQEEERRALARDLHDEFGQAVHLIRVEAAYLGNLGNTGNREADAALRRIREAGEDLNRLLRGMLDDLRPSLLDTMGLESALQDLCAGWSERSGIPCRVDTHALPQDLDNRLPAGAAIALYRAVQEGLLNIMKHSGAHEARVMLRLPQAPGGMLELDIADDGCGLANIAAAGQLGLLGMGERLVAVGATMALESEAGQGLTIRIHLPVAPAEVTT